MELAPEHLDPGVVLHSWVSWYLAVERLPERRVVVRFQFPGLPKKGGELWIIFHGERSEVCRRTPASSPTSSSRPSPPRWPSGTWGRIEWADAVRAERVGVLGPAPSPGRCRPGTAAAPPPGREAPPPRRAEPAVTPGSRGGRSGL